MTELPTKWQGVKGVRPSVTGVDTGLIPDPLRSFEEWARYWHRDIPELDDFELWSETKRLEAAIANGERNAWLKERLRRLYAERERRRRAQGGDK